MGKKARRLIDRQFVVIENAGWLRDLLSLKTLANKKRFKMQAVSVRRARLINAAKAVSCRDWSVTPKFK